MNNHTMSEHAKKSLIRAMQSYQTRSGLTVASN